jgi:hypothetical protein
MDATRPRRMQDNARQRWYALSRSVRFARFLRFSVPLNGIEARFRIASLTRDR